jgi:hypothetical protein
LSSDDRRGTGGRALWPTIVVGERWIFIFLRCVAKLAQHPQEVS